MVTADTLREWRDRLRRSAERPEQSWQVDEVADQITAVLCANADDEALDCSVDGLFDAMATATRRQAESLRVVRPS